LIPSANRSVYLLLVAAIAAVTWLGLQMLNADAHRAERQAAEEAFPELIQESRVPAPQPRRAVRVRVVEARQGKPLSADELVLRELDRVLVFESDLRPDEFDVRGIVNYLSRKLNARVQLSRTAREALSRPVQLPDQRATARAVLDRITLLAGLRWEVHRGKVRITGLGEVA